MTMKKDLSERGIYTKFITSALVQTGGDVQEHTRDLESLFRSITGSHRD